MNKRRTENIILIVLAVVALGAVIVFSLPDISLCADERANMLWLDILPRAAVCPFLFCLLRFVVCGKPGKKKGRELLYSFLWCLPCLCVALVNFPYSALIGGAAAIERTDLIWLFILKCLSIGLLEELFFRGILLPVLIDRLQEKKRPRLYSVLLSSALFALWHLVNLFFGAGVPAVLLQVGYTFLLGCMFSAAYLKTGNIWVSVFLHTLFDFGGVIVTDLGSGAFQDTVFWILTVLFGVICAGHVGIYLLLTDKKTE